MEPFGATHYGGLFVFFFFHCRKLKIRAKKALEISGGAEKPCFFPIYRMLPTVRGKRMTSRMFCMPVQYMTMRSKPRPYPPCGTEPYLRRSR